MLVLQVSGAVLGESQKGEVWGKAEQGDSATGKNTKKDLSKCAFSLIDSRDS